MNEEEALWAAIDCLPEDQLRRLVLADWLVENDTPGGPCVACGGHGLVDENGNGCGEGITCQACRGFGEFTPDGRADMAMALRATCDRVPWVKVFENGFGWWCKRSFHDDIDHLIERTIMNEMSDSRERCDRDDTVRFDKRDGVSGGVILFPTASAAIKDLCRAWIAVHCKSEVKA